MGIGPVPERQRRTSLRRKGKMMPGPRGSSMLRTRRKATSTDLLTFDEEREIAGTIKLFRSVTQARENLMDWMCKNGAIEMNQNMEPLDHQWASACSLSVDQLHDIVTRGQEARTRLIKANVGLVTMIAKRYHSMLSYGGMAGSTGGGAGGTDATLKLDDLVQEGYMGIMEAAERFDPTRGFRFSTYATHWIRQRIVRAIAESSRMIRLPVHVQTIIRNMHKTHKNLEEQIGRKPSMPELAHEMGVPLDKINLYQHLSKNVLSLELPVDRHSNTEDKRTLGDRVACTEMATPDEDFLSESMRGEVHAMLDALGQVERLVLTHRFGLYDGRPKSIRETAEGMGVSSDVVRNVESKALNKLRQPRMNYRVKEYIGSPDAFSGESEYSESHVAGSYYNSFESDFEEQLQEPHQQPQQQHHHYYHYPHHMNAARSNEHENTNDDDLQEYERPTPESIWSF
jgi:RNA polymerase sigma factor (sigma-70 family)